MVFEVHDLNNDVLEITVFDKDLFSPNGKLYDKLKDSFLSQHLSMILLPHLVRVKVCLCLTPSKIG